MKFNVWQGFWDTDYELVKFPIKSYSLVKKDITWEEAKMLVSGCRERFTTTSDWVPPR